MRILRVLGIVFLLAGAASYFFADYIADQVTQGKEQIAAGQKKVDTIEQLSASNPYTKDVGSMFAKSGQKKIDAGKKDVAKYEELSSQLSIGGIALGILGIVMFGISFFPSKHH